MRTGVLIGRYYLIFKKNRITLISVAKAAMDYTHLPTLLYGIGAVAIMVILRKINPRIPNVLVAVAITT